MRAMWSDCSTGCAPRDGTALPSISAPAASAGSHDPPARGPVPRGQDRRSRVRDRPAAPPLGRRTPGGGGLFPRRQRRAQVAGRDRQRQPGRRRRDRLGAVRSRRRAPARSTRLGSGATCTASGSCARCGARRWQPGTISRNSWTSSPSAPAGRFADYDGAVIARLYGFASAQDYWTRCSARAFLATIRRPTLLISGADDPFIPPSAIPQRRDRAEPGIDPVPGRPTAATSGSSRARRCGRATSPTI